MVSQESKTSSQSRDLGPSEEGQEPSPRRGKKGASFSKKAKKRAPLDEVSLKDLALSYVARFATTGAKLESYLARKLRERGVAEDEDGRTRELDVPGLVSRLVELGYVDDAAYAASKSRDLTARGYGKRRVEQALWAAGVDEDVRADNAPDELVSRQAAAMLARKRRFGPYRLPPEGEGPEARRKMREKHLAAMLRAGHTYTHAGFIVDAAAIDEIEDWLAEAEAEAEETREEGGLW